MAAHPVDIGAPAVTPNAVNALFVLVESYMSQVCFGVVQGVSQ